MYESDWKKFTDVLVSWDYEKNAKEPYSYSVGSAKKVYWKCKECGGVYQSEIRSKTINGAGCPFCTNKKALPGFNDLKTKHPELLSEWDYEKNKVMPENITPGSHAKVWWKCPKCHGEWSTQLFSRVNSQTRCPFCTNYKVLPGFNDLKTKHPELLSEWDYEKNKVLPENIISGGGDKKAWWKCQYGHSWFAEISNRVNGSKCPVCTKRKQSSFPEQAIFFYIRQFYKDAINSYKDIFDGGMEIDVFIPSLKVGIEYDGRNWHKGKKLSLEERKYKICQLHGIKLIRIKENRSHSDATCDELIYCDFDRLNYSALDKAIIELCRILGLNPDINTERDSLAIKEQYLSLLRGKSLQTLFPEIAKEWHPTKNGSLTPDMFEFGSIEKVWWKCPKCHGEWQTTINLRTNQRTKCPYCSGKKVLKGFNDLATTRPDLVLDWDYENNTKRPDEITKGSNYRAHWKCHKCGHEWCTIVDRRGTANTGCPNCYQMNRKRKK